jgi:hypothetical protein
MELGVSTAFSTGGSTAQSVGSGGGAGLEDVAGGGGGLVEVFHHGLWSDGSVVRCYSVFGEVLVLI